MSMILDLMGRAHPHRCQDLQGFSAWIVLGDFDECGVLQRFPSDSVVVF